MGLLDMTKPSAEWLGHTVKSIHNLDQEGVVVGYNDECVIVDYDGLTQPKQEPFQSLIVLENPQRAERT